MASNSGVNGIVRPVANTYVGVDNVVRSVSRTYVGVANAVRPVNRTYVGVYVPFTEVRVVLKSISIWTIDTSNGNIKDTLSPATLANARNYASINIDETNRRISICAHPGYAVQINFEGTTIGQYQTNLKSAVSNAETFSLSITSSGWAGGRASGFNRHIAFGAHLLPNGWYDSGSDTVTLSKETLTSYTGELYNAVLYGSCTDQMTFPATAKVNGLDIPVTLVNQLS